MLWLRKSLMRVVEGREGLCESCNGAVDGSVLGAGEPEFVLGEVPFMRGGKSH